MIELKNSKLTRLPDAPNGRQRFALDCSIGAIQMRADSGEWQDIKPRLVKDVDGWHAEGTPYALKILDDGTRTIYPDRTELGKYIHLPAPAMLHGLPKRIEGNRLIFYTPAFEITYQLTNTGIQFTVLLMKAPIPFDRIALDVEAVGLDIDELLKAKKGLGIPRPRLIDFENGERWLDWSYKAGKLELGFDLSGLKFPILLKNTTIDKDVEAAGDDAYAYNTFFENVTQLRMGKESADNIRAFARFTGVEIPADAIIGANCYASFFVWSSTQPGVYLKVKADDSANPDAPTDATEVFAITPTTAGVDWDDQADVDDWANTPDIQSVIAELQASYDYSAGAAITIIVDDDGGSSGERIITRAYEYNDHSLAPKLHIEYTVGGVTHEGAATLSGVGTLAGIGRGIFIGKSTLSGTGTLAAIGSFLRYATATLSGTGTLVAIGRGIFIGKATLAGIGTLASIGRLIAIGKATLAGAGTLSAIGRLIAIGKATLSGMGTLSAIGSFLRYATATLSGQGSLSAIGRVVKLVYGKATLSGVGTLAAIGRGIFVGSATLAGTGTLTVRTAWGRVLKIVAITSQYRGLNIITAQNRLVKVITSQYRKVKSFTGLGG